MDVIAINSQTYKSHEQKIDKIAEFVATAEVTQQKKDPDFTDVKLEIEELCDILGINRRTI